MCQVVVSWADNHQVATATTAQKWGLRQRGDVVDVIEDWMDAGRAVEVSPRLKVVKLPGVPVSTLRFLTEATEVTRRLRTWKVDATRAFVPKRFQKYFDDANTITLDPAQVSWILDFVEAREV